jgi:hypothetical protein
MSTSTLSSRFSAEVRANLARRQQAVGALAEHLGISEATAYRWLNGGQWPLNEADAAARWFGFDSVASMLRAAPPVGAAS